MSANNEMLEHLPPPEDKPVAKLLLDVRNPRIIDVLGDNPSQARILKYLWDESAAEELVLSIAKNGFFPHEPLFVEPVGDNYVVIEGNRRLAAVKLLLDEELRRELNIGNVPQLSAEVRESLFELPVVVTTRAASWKHIGFKHVNGPKQWDSVAKARYIVQVKVEHGASLDEIAQTIGDTNDTVERLFRGMKVLTQAEDNGLFDVADSHTGKLAFSHLYTGLGYANTRQYLGIAAGVPADDLAVPEDHLQNLKQYLLWLYGSRIDEIEPIVRSQNPDLRNLDRVLGSEQGIDTLMATNSLERARRIAVGEREVLREKLIKAKAELQDAYGMVGSGLQTDEAARRLANQIFRLAQNLVGAMTLVEHVRNATNAREDQ